MLDCFCPRVFEWEQPTAAPASRENVPPETFPNQRPPAVPDGPPSWLALETFVAQLLHQLHVCWVLCGAFLRWFALLVSTMEAVLLAVSMLSQASWKYRLQWRPLRHIPEYLRINFALVVSVLTIYANLAAIAGVLMCDGAGQPLLLLPYIVLNMLRLGVEFTHRLADRFGAPLTPPGWNSDGEAAHWRSTQVLVQCCSLSIMIAVYFDVVPHGGTSSPSTGALLQQVQAWYRRLAKTYAGVKRGPSIPAFSGRV